MALFKVDNQGFKNMESGSLVHGKGAFKITNYEDMPRISADFKPGPEDVEASPAPYAETLRQGEKDYKSYRKLVHGR